MSAIAASRGKRKLDFDSQCFKGKTMFLDLAGYHRTPEIEHELTERGATIEHFFHRGVKYLVTNRPKKEGQSTPSPHTPGTAHSVGKSSWSQLVSPMTDSRLGTDKRSTQQPPIYRSRAQKILQMSLEVRLWVYSYMKPTMPSLDKLISTPTDNKWQDLQTNHVT